MHSKSTMRGNSLAWDLTCVQSLPEIFYLLVAIMTIITPPFHVVVLLTQLVAELLLFLHQNSYQYLSVSCWKFSTIQIGCLLSFHASSWAQRKLHPTGVGLFLAKVSVPVAGRRIVVSGWEGERTSASQQGVWGNVSTAAHKRTADVGLLKYGGSWLASIDTHHHLQVPIRF